MLALLGAFKEEIAGVRRQMTVAEVVATPNCKLYRGKYLDRDCLLVQTGLGKQRVEAATRFILEHFQISSIISFGFAGALTPGLRTGDIIICSMLYYCNGRIQKGLEPESLSCDSALLEVVSRALEGGTAGFCCGSSVTVPQLLANPELKEKLSKISQAHIADMESYWVARIASEKQVPFLAIRAVFDTFQESMPPFDRILAGDGGRLRGKAFSYFALHPQDLLKLPGLYSGSRKARASLTDCIAQVVASIN